MFPIEFEKSLEIQKLKLFSIFIIVLILFKSKKIAFDNIEMFDI